ncbi:excalibur calcium-binding domain-containing protein [Hoyosella sp. YIM 151337]|uniref:excalibur calcium-binding domain-containing protein n=1 Tax=Hoyosella sp. YIM 151337 TaxID=2992742 RepID=UPI002236945A|nr:excalibur calcium-binding domain-containing protein [Hoyosella sp. YIM 151337]MCW4353795.1 excalibur calcium-binding domain-containing protein [Hoyosella sp. YIM 151337]
MYPRRVTAVLLAAAFSLTAAPAVANAYTAFDYLPAEIAAMIPSGSADAVIPLLPPPPAQPPAFVIPEEWTAWFAPAPPAPQNSPAPPRNVQFQNCKEAWDAGVAPIRRGEPGYAPHLDRDNDGIACEVRPNY